jgi:hypothetical protein
MPSYRSGSTTTVTDSKFLAAARIMAGPPMSMFSITASGSAPLATGLAERIEPADQQVEGLDAERLDLTDVIGVAAIGEQPGVDRGDAAS